MKKILTALLILAFCLGFAQRALAEDYEDGDRLPASVIQPLMSWVELHTGVRVPYMPQVIASQSILADIVGRKGRIMGRARALYVSGMVVLDHRYFDAEDTTQLSLLVHELVHYAQSYRPQTAWACPQEKEVEAYTLQNNWLEEQGHSPYVRASWIARMAACPAGQTETAVAMAE
ncbi:MAG: hypothetical protein PHW63_01375 [Alphaproteobacteria bacterium]|nr:hypothetical protein [Alphaproteobacteria bacterium]